MIATTFGMQPVAYRPNLHKYSTQSEQSVRWGRHTGRQSTELQYYYTGSHARSVRHIRARQIGNWGVDSVLKHMLHRRRKHWSLTHVRWTYLFK